MYKTTQPLNVLLNKKFSPLKIKLKPYRQIKQYHIVVYFKTKLRVYAYFGILITRTTHSILKFQIVKAANFKISKKEEDNF